MPVASYNFLQQAPMPFAADPRIFDAKAFYEINIRQNFHYYFKSIKFNSLEQII